MTGRRTKGGNVSPAPPIVACAAVKGVMEEGKEGDREGGHNVLEVIAAI